MKIRKIKNIMMTNRKGKRAKATKNLHKFKKMNTMRLDGMNQDDSGLSSMNFSKSRSQIMEQDTDKNFGVVLKRRED